MLTEDGIKRLTYMRESSYIDFQVPTKTDQKILLKTGPRIYVSILCGAELAFSISVKKKKFPRKLKQFFFQSGSFFLRLVGKGKQNNFNFGLICLFFLLLPLNLRGLQTKLQCRWISLFKKASNNHEKFMANTGSLCLTIERLTTYLKT